MNLLSLLKSRKEQAKSFTKDFHDKVKLAIKDYKADQQSLNKILNVEYTDIVSARYQIVHPLIFTNHEAMMASMFDRMPNLIVKQRGEDDYEKEIKIKATYEYLKDKLQLDWIVNELGWWFILIGFASTSAGYKVETEEVPVIGENGEIEYEMNEDGEMVPMTRIEYIYDDPTIDVDDPLKTYFSSESKYSPDASDVPFKIRYDLMTVDQVKETYGVEVEPDAKLEVSDNYDMAKTGKGDVTKTDTDRVKVYFYEGNLPSKVRNDEMIKDWSYNCEYSIVFTTKKILDVTKLPGKEKLTTLAKWYGPPNEFFGYGIGKTLRPYQVEKSIRRQQQLVYADKAAYSKLLVDKLSQVDDKAIADPRANPVTLYDSTRGEKPSYLSPPDIGNIVNQTDQQADQDAQQVSGMLDISQGAQNTATVKTATGQSIFADAAEKRMRIAKKKFLRTYKQMVIQLFKLAKQNWQSTKLIEITDRGGEMVEAEISAEDLSDINFDNDIDIDPESVTLNVDVLRAQAIELYNLVKDDPLVDRKEVFKSVIKDGFNKEDPQRFIKDQELEPGTQLINLQTGEQYQVDDTGEVVKAEAQAQTAQPQGQPGGNIPTSQAGLMGAQSGSRV